MIRAFTDASALFAAAYSETGASREIIRLAIREKVRLVASELVFEEARRNLEDKAPRAVAYLADFRAAVDFEIVRPSKREVVEVMEYTATKDAPIVAAAKASKVDYLVSLDRHHLVEVPEVAKHSGLKIVLPADLLAEIRKQTDVD